MPTFVLSNKGCKISGTLNSFESIWPPSFSTGEMYGGDAKKITQALDAFSGEWKQLGLQELDLEGLRSVVSEEAWAGLSTASQQELQALLRETGTESTPDDDEFLIRDMLSGSSAPFRFENPIDTLHHRMHALDLNDTAGHSSSTFVGKIEEEQRDYLQHAESCSQRIERQMQIRCRELAEALSVSLREVPAPHSADACKKNGTVLRELRVRDAHTRGATLRVADADMSFEAAVLAQSLECGNNCDFVRPLLNPRTSIVGKQADPSQGFRAEYADSVHSRSFFVQIKEALVNLGPLPLALLVGKLQEQRQRIAPHVPVNPSWISPFDEERSRALSALPHHVPSDRIFNQVGLTEFGDKIKTMLVFLSMQHTLLLPPKMYSDGAEPVVEAALATFDPADNVWKWTGPTSEKVNGMLCIMESIFDVPKFNGEKPVLISKFVHDELARLAEVKALEAAAAKIDDDADMDSESAIGEACGGAKRKLSSLDPENPLDLARGMSGSSERSSGTPTSGENEGKQSGKGKKRHSGPSKLIRPDDPTIDQSRVKQLKNSHSSTIPITSEEMKEAHNLLEKERYLCADIPFVFKDCEGKDTTVGPATKNKKHTNPNGTIKIAREHALLLSGRPITVTILSLVRDAAARLPSSVGNRADIVSLIKDSIYIVFDKDKDDGKLQQAVSGALDRLRFEKDPCVCYEHENRLWRYLHRERPADEEAFKIS
jgi:hypothetical protein